MGRNVGFGPDEKMKKRLKIGVFGAFLARFWHVFGARGFGFGDGLGCFPGSGHYRGSRGRAPTMWVETPEHHPTAF